MFWQWIDLLGAGDVFSTKMNDAADAETEVVLDVSGDAKSAVTAQSKSWSEMIENKHAMIERIVSKAMELTDTFLASHHSVRDPTSHVLYRS